MSKNFLEVAKQIFPGGANTRSKRPSMIPFVVTGGKGAYLEIKGHQDRVIDWSASCGTIILGYNSIADDIVASGFGSELNSVPSVTKNEILLGEKLLHRNPFMEQVRLFKTGSEATLAAVRLARTITKRKHIIASGYHGWHDWYSSIYDPVLPQNTTLIPYGDLDALALAFKNHEGDIACVITEPIDRFNKRQQSIVSNVSLKMMKEMCADNGALFIMDELLTGFRCNSKWDTADPDLVCYGKTMANGYSVAALLGRQKYMEHLENGYVGGTFAGEGFPIAMARYTIDKIESLNIANQLEEKSKLLNSGFATIFSTVGTDYVVSFRSFGPITFFRWGTTKKSQEARSIFCAHTLENNVLYADQHFITAAHTRDDIMYTLGVYAYAIKQALKWNNNYA